MIRFEGMAKEVMEAMCTPMHQILPTRYPHSTSPTIHSVNRISPNTPPGNLFLGSMSATMDRELLKTHHITHVVQVIDAPWAQISEVDGLRCLRIDIHDKPTADLKPHLEGACQYIASALASGGNVLVHCQQVRARDPDNTGAETGRDSDRVSPDHLPSSSLTSSIISGCRMIRPTHSSNVTGPVSIQIPDLWRLFGHGKTNGAL